MFSEEIAVLPISYKSRHECILLPSSSHPIFCTRGTI